MSACVCGNREPHRTAACDVVESARQRVIATADARGVDRVAALDVWAHARGRLDAVDAARVVTDVIDLGWRPVVGFEVQP